jgi:hypothetical protein
MGKMSVEEVWALLVYCGDAVVPGGGQNDLHVLAVEVVHRLPRKVQTWLLSDTSHVFIGGHGQRGEFIELGFPPQEVEDGFVKVRLVFLSEQLMGTPVEEATWTIARQIGHSWQDYVGRSTAADVDRLVKRWGFAEPAGRADDRQGERTPARPSQRRQGGQLPSRSHFRKKGTDP